MYIEHVALWTQDLEGMKEFYEKYFNVTSNEIYHNPMKGFYSYFLTFESGARMELMSRDNITEKVDIEMLGYAHIAISLGSKEEVNRLTSKIEADGFEVASPTRTTGDGYYESVILDPDGNRIELTV